MLIGDDNKNHKVKIIIKDISSFAIVPIVPRHIEGELSDFENTKNILSNGSYISAAEYMAEEKQIRENYLNSLPLSSYENYIFSLIDSLNIPRNDVEYDDGYILASLSEKQINIIEAEHSPDILDIVIDADYNYVDIAGAMLATEIDPYALDYSSRHGDGINIFMSDETCPNEISGYLPPYYIPIFRYKYDRLSGSTEALHSKVVYDIIRAVSPESYVYCKENFVLPFVTDYADYDFHIQTHSWHHANGNLGAS